MQWPLLNQGEQGCWDAVELGMVPCPLGMLDRASSVAPDYPADLVTSTASWTGSLLALQGAQSFLSLKPTLLHCLHLGYQLDGHHLNSEGTDHF